MNGKQDSQTTITVDATQLFTSGFARLLGDPSFLLPGGLVAEGVSSETGTEIY